MNDEARDVNPLPVGPTVPAGTTASNVGGAGAAGVDERGAANQARRSPSAPSLKWHESWIMRAAGLASFIILLGYAFGALFTFESIESIINLAYDQEIEESLGSHLTSIKRVHELQQQLVFERLKPVAEPWIASHGPDVPDATLKTWLAEAGLGDDQNTTPLGITAFHQSAGAKAATLAWLDRDRLKIGERVVEFPKGPLYDSFKAAEDVRQRYQLVGVKLEEQIRPTLIRFSATVLVVSFLLLVSLFFIYAQRFKARTFEVIEGFSIWSEKDDKFRFDERYRGYQGELRLITQQFNAMADEVEANRQRSLYLEKIASWQIIARKLAHEIKNPLTPIQMMVSQLKRRYKGDDKEFAKLLDDAQSIITEEVAGLRRMVDNFSNFARLPEPEPRPADLVALCRHVLELERNAFAQHHFVFESRLAKIVAVVDEDLLRQVLLNLIKNACEASGETPAVVTVGLEIDGPDVAITVKDTGPGIPPELRTRIFEAYFTTKHTGPNPGMGLGLAVCQKIVIDHGGKMIVRSRPGETVFTIRLPLKKKETSV